MNRARISATLVFAVLLSGCTGRTGDPKGATLDAAAESYVRLVLALGERDADSLDAYHGPPQWQADARARHATLAEIRTEAVALIGALRPAAVGADDVRRQFLVRQLRAVAARIEVLLGARQRFADEARALFALDVTADAYDGDAGASIRAELDRLIPGRGELSARYAAFDRTFLIVPDRLPSVLSRAMAGCRSVTRARLNLPANERVDVEYVHDIPWSAFTRYQGGFASRIQVNAGLPLTVDRALDLACHEAYPGHHTIESLLDARFSRSHTELFVKPLFSPLALLHEAASSMSGELAFPERARLAFERDELFPLAGLDPASAERHVRVARLVDRLRRVQAVVLRRYLDGELDFPRAAAALERDALMYSADTTLKFINQYRTYAATYTLGRDAFARVLDARAGADEEDSAARWRVYAELVTDPSQALPSASR